MTIIFEECDVCKKKPGMPVLCNNCLIERKLVHKINKEELGVNMKTEEIQKRLDDLNKKIDSEYICRNIVISLIESGMIYVILEECARSAYITEQSLNLLNELNNAV